MPYLPVDTDIRVVVGPLIDDTDFKSVETGVAYNATGMSTGVDLLLKGVATTSKTDITPADTGDNEWDELGNGYYFLQITDLQNITEGTLQVVGQGVSGILPFESPVYTVVPITVYNSLVAGSDTLAVDVTQWLGTAAATPTTAGVPEVDVTHVAGTSQTAGDIPALVTTVDTVVDSILADTGTDGVVVNTFTTAGKAEIEAECDDSLATYDAPTKAELDSGLAALNDISTGDVDTALSTYDAATGTELAAVDTKIDTIDANVDSILADTGTDGVIVASLGATAKNEVNAECDTALTGYDAATGTELSAVDGKIDTIDTNVDAILADTGTDGVIVASLAANSITSSVVQNGAITADKIADAAKTFPKGEDWSVSAYISLSSDNKSPATSKTITCEISKDGGVWAATDASVAEEGNGIYSVALDGTVESETVADRIDMRWYETSETGDVNETNISIYTAP